MVTVTVKHLLTELRDAALDGLAVARRLEASDIPQVKDAGEIMARWSGRWTRALEEACSQTRVEDGPTHRLQLRLL